MAKDFSNTANVSLGLENNNPGNIIFDGTQWQGMTGSNQGFVTFTNIDYGIRALGIDLSTKINEDGLTTIRQIVEKYAPASDGNNVPVYINTMVQTTGKGADEKLIADPATLFLLVKGIILQENGQYSASLITNDDIIQGLSMINGVSFVNVSIPTNEMMGLSGSTIFFTLVVALLISIYER